MYVCMYVVCKLLDLGHAGLGHAELGQRDWDMRNWDSGTETGATRTAGLGHAELGQRDWDMRNWDSATGTFLFVFFVIRMLKKIFAMVSNNFCY